MKYSRTPLSTDPAFSLAALKVHARIDHADDDAALDLMGRAAVAEIEAYCDLALMPQIVTAETDEWAEIVPLPVGPLYAAGTVANPVTIYTRDDAGTLTEQPGAGWIAAGRYPCLHLSLELTGAALVVEYPAGFGADATAIPADLQLAISDHAAMLYDRRGDAQAPQGLSLAAARIAARHRKVRA